MLSACSLMNSRITCMFDDGLLLVSHCSQVPSSFEFASALQTRLHPSLGSVLHMRLAMLQLVLVWNAPASNAASMSRLQKLADHLWRQDAESRANGQPRLLHSIWANLQTSPGNVILSTEWRHLLGEQHLWSVFQPSPMYPCFHPSRLQVFEMCLMLLWDMVFALLGTHYDRVPLHNRRKSTLS